jgi:hypothetical protein
VGLPLGCEAVPDPLELTPPLAGAGTAPPEPQPQAHGGQLLPAGQIGQWQVQVPFSTQPFGSLPPVQEHAHGGQSWPGRHAGQLQVHDPPEPLPPPEQSHSGWGQGPPAGQATGVTQEQEPPLASRGWQ